jgi:glycerol-3-phosphate dehydrogenase (NAD(P)+)
MTAPAETAATGPIGVVGAGSWGTALAANFGACGREVVVWARRAEVAAAMVRERENRGYLPGVPLGDAVRPTADLADLADCDPLLLVVPSHGLREVLRRLLAVGAGPRTLVSAAKGVEGETLARMSQVCAEESAAAGRATGFAVLSGPTFAAEVGAGMPTAAVVAAAEPGLADRLQRALSTPSLRLYSSADVAGVELAGTAKNVIAIAAGVVSGLGLGHNTLAALITRGLHEITRLGLAYGGQERTFSGLAGLGDLVLTCTGGLSRNRRVGLELAAGRTLARIAAGTSMVAEGVRNSLAVARLAAARRVEMPITEQMVGVMYEGKPPRRAVDELMRRELKAESDL